MKDLRVFEQLGYGLNEVVLIDNATHCFGFQVDNGVPMVPFYNNMDDREMVHLLHFLEQLKDVEDVRPILHKTFNLPDLRDPSILSKIDGVIEVECQDITDEELMMLENSENVVVHENKQRSDQVLKLALKKSALESNNRKAENYKVKKDEENVDDDDSETSKENLSPTANEDFFIKDPFVKASNSWEQ